MERHECEQMPDGYIVYMGGLLVSEKPFVEGFGDDIELKINFCPFCGDSVKIQAPELRFCKQNST